MPRTYGHNDHAVQQVPASPETDASVLRDGVLEEAGEEDKAKEKEPSPIAKLIEGFKSNE